MAPRSDAKNPKKTAAAPKKKAAAVPVTSEPDGPWQQRAVDRSINSARLRALARSSQFLAAAMELLEETGDIDFTLQSLIDRSNLNLRAFYQHFESKDDLILSLFEELATRFNEELGAAVEGIADPIEQLKAYTSAFLRQSHASLPYGGRAWTTYQMRLAAERPADFMKSTERLVGVLHGIIQRGMDENVFRTDLPAMAMTLLVNSALTTAGQMDVLELKAEGQSIGADEVWAWCRSAVLPSDAATKVAARTRRATR